MYKAMVHIKKLKTKAILTIFAIVTILDFIVTMMVKSKHQVFNESNPIYLFTGNIWFLLIIKLIVVIAMTIYFIKYYSKTPIYFRYILSTILLFGIILQFIATINGNNVYEKPKEEVEPISKEIKLQYYKQQIIWPYLNSIIGLTFIFLFWRMIENDR